MNEQLFEDVIEKHNYIVKVEFLDSDREEAVKLKVNYADLKEEIYTCEKDSILMTIDGEEIFLPVSVMRLYVLANIYLQCRKLNLPYSIVRFYKGGEKTNLISLLPLTFNELDVANELDLHDIMIKVLEKNKLLHSFDDELAGLGLLQKFNLLKGLLT